jgi:hypothetical protein
MSTGHPTASCYSTFTAPRAPGREVGPFVSEGPTDRMNVWIIAIDRPGMGLSDFGARWTIGNWRADAAALANAIPDCEARFYRGEAPRRCSPTTRKRSLAL